MRNTMRNFKLSACLTIVVCIVSCGEQPTAPAEQTDVSVNSTPAEAFSDTVNAPRLVSQVPGDSLVLTAETGRGIGPAIKYMPEWRAFGWFTSADSVVWDVDVKDAGEYSVFLEWSVDDKEAGKEFILRSGSNRLTGKVGKSGSWETFKTENVGTLKLENGFQNIVFKSAKEFNKEGALLDLRSLKFVKKS